MDYTKWYNKYCADCDLKYNSENTRSNYKSCVSLFISKFKYVDQPQRIANDDIKQWLLEAKTINTRKHRLCAINSFYKITVGMPSKIQKIPYPKSEKKLPIVLSQDEVQRMFNVCENLKHKVLLSILYACGLRVSELINLKWSNIDRSRMIINIIKGKGNKDRQVMLPEVLIPLLEKYYREYKSKEYVFNGQKTLQYSDRSVLQVVKNLAGKAGISKKVCTHLMRHNCFTHLCEAGTDISIIQKLAGHSNVKTTMIYVHISDSLISKINSPINSINL
ncbi:MAG: tyrosine-type recombinase/integrase [Saprospiraceae bacterium]|nr:tyrosine-type recombinase/integrase [Saprospiraceae bacterium]